MERFPLLIALLFLLIVFPGCKRGEWTRASHEPLAETATPVWIELSLHRTGVRFQGHSNQMLQHRFAAISGRTSSYDDGLLHLDLTPRANGDGTITMIGTLREDTPHAAPQVVPIPSFTVLENRATDHEVQDLHLHCCATTDPHFFPYLDRPRVRTTFLEGTYVTGERGSFVSHSYTFERGHFVDHLTADAGPQGSFQGGYEIDGERLVLTFDGSDRPPCVLTHLIVDDVHVLMDLGERSDGSRSGGRSGCFVRLPAEARNDPDWWGKLLAAHPTFAKALPGGGK